jgi:hypothetical protein
MKAAIPFLLSGAVFDICTINLQRDLFNDLKFSLFGSSFPLADEKSSTQTPVGPAAFIAKGNLLRTLIEPERFPKVLLDNF